MFIPDSDPKIYLIIWDPGSYIKRGVQKNCFFLHDQVTFVVNFHTKLNFSSFSVPVFLKRKN
jgi:hypothetical protein